MNGQPEVLIIITICYVALSAILFLIALLIIYRLLRRIARLWTAGGEIFGGNLKTRLIGLGISSLFFPTVLPNFLLAIFNFVTGFIRALLSDFPRGLETIVQLCKDSGGYENCVTQSGIKFLDMWGGAISNALSTLNLAFLPYGSLVLMLALWAVISEFLRATKGPETDSGKIWLYDAFTKLGQVARQNLYFFLALAIAGYLSVAAIIAIPEVRQAAPVSEKVSVERLQQQLDQAQQEAEFNFKRELNLGNPFSKLEELINKYDVKVEDKTAAQSAVSPSNPPVNVATPSPSPAEQSQTNSAKTKSSEGLSKPFPTPDSVSAIANEQVGQTQQKINDILDLYTNQKIIRDELHKRYARLVQNTLSQSKDMKTIIISTYEASNAYRIGGREKVQHFLALSAYYREQLSELNATLNSCESAIGNSDIAWRVWSSQALDVIAHRQEENIVSEIMFYNLYLKTSEACRSTKAAKAIPERPSLGSYLGAFGFVARWLVSTESLPLALITGLLGFGLLGSACSTFVRERVRQPSRGPLVMDLPSVVIRGLSAAIVVFLAVEGGLAIFASTGSEPNPYMLLLTCLVAAVFSEDVWKWAHDKLLDNFISKGKEHDRQEAENSGPSVAPPTAVAENPTTAEKEQDEPGA
jgi:hypothetical protein